MRKLDVSIMQTKTVCSIVDVLLKVDVDDEDLKEQINYIKQCHIRALRSMPYYKGISYYNIKQIMFNEDLNRKRYLDPRKYNISKLNDKAAE
jgi:hypothetical protein